MDSNDSLWALVVPVVVIALMRLVDALVPKGYMFKIVRRWMIEADDDDRDRKDKEDKEDDPASPPP